VSDRIDNNINGIVIPIPKNINDNIFWINDVIVTDLANKAAISNGLHGITIAPKKNPYKNALIYGFFDSGVTIWGNFKKLIFILNINFIDIIANIINAIGEIIPIILFKDNSNMLVNNNPIININVITPRDIIIPNFKTWFLSFESEFIWFDK